ncbi:F [Diatraea saccharalis granulovirus]|uniref:F n=1 Tax=Diatraea saccharalis granulovirus TaxID=1675862 RepID=A0A0R7EYP8_9BBAC|nr:F [Diatraea saccharalis granulovirus] [Diatraea saccharalis granulovirus]AKN80710.1 F [Diatraea saccharalis granulovirus] [Diatraea saccharalis granulovirus]
MWIFLALLPFVNSIKYYENRIINETGFHYEFHSNLRFVVNSWNFLLDIDYNNIKTKVDIVKNTSLILQNEMRKKKCNYTGGINTKINNLVNLHKDIYFLIEHKRLVLNNSMNFEEESTRKKRSLWIFEFLGLRNGLDFDLMLHDIRMDHNIQNLTNDMLLLTQTVKEYDGERNCYALNEQIWSLKDNLDEIEVVLKKIFRAIEMALTHNKVDYMILNTTLFIEKIKLVNDKDTEWIVQPSMEELHNIIRLAYCNVFINDDNKIRFVIRLPRVDKTKFMLFKTISIPNCDDKGVCKYLTPKSQYIGFSKKKLYVRLADISSCTKYDNKTLCYESVTAKKLEASEDCDVKLYSGQPYENCEVRATRFHNEIFFNLNNMNRWLYRVERVNADITCGTGRFSEHLILKGTGIITLNRFCKLRTPQLVLTSKDIIGNNSYQIINFNFTRFIIPEDYVVHKKIVNGLDFDSLNSISEDLKILLTKEKIKLIKKNESGGWFDWLSDIYSNLFGNWWWEVKFFIYCILISIVLCIIIKIKNLLT